MKTTEQNENLDIYPNYLYSCAEEAFPYRLCIFHHNKEIAGHMFKHVPCAPEDVLDRNYKVVKEVLRSQGFFDKNYEANKSQNLPKIVKAADAHKKSVESLGFSNLEQSLKTINEKIQKYTTIGKFDFSLPIQTVKPFQAGIEKELKDQGFEIYSDEYSFRISWVN